MAAGENPFARRRRDATEPEVEPDPTPVASAAGKPTS